MRLLKAFLVMSVAAVSAAWACPAPANIEGVAFTSGEAMYLENLTKLGVLNVNYFVDGEQPYTAVRYKSHYDQRAMVYVGNYGLSYQQGVRMNCMGVILPLQEGADPYAQIGAGDFDFIKAVSTELQWLTAVGAVDLSQEAISEIAAGLAGASNGGVQYWTHAKAVQGYNAWYTYDEATGQWAGANGVFGVRGGVDTVQGVDAIDGCSVVKPGSGLPPEMLGTSSVRVSRRVLPNGFGTLSLRQAAPRAAVVTFSRALESPGSLTFINCAGAVIARASVASGARSCSVSLNARFVPGWYRVELRSGGRIEKLSAPILFR